MTRECIPVKALRSGASSYRTVVPAALTLLLWAVSVPNSMLAAQQPLAIERVTVVDPLGAELLEDHTVYVDGGVVVWVGPADAAPTPAAAQRVDGEGRFVVAGLVDVHARFPAQNDPMRVVVLDEILWLHVANGVTTVRVPDGAPYLIGVRDRITRGEQPGPYLSVGSPEVDRELLAGTATPVSLIASLKEVGYDFVTLGDDLSEEQRRDLTEAAADRSLPVVGSWPSGQRVGAVPEGMVVFLDGLDVFVSQAMGHDAPSPTSPGEPSEFSPLISHLHEVGAYVAPLEYVSQHEFGRAVHHGGFVHPTRASTTRELNYVPVRQRETWDNQYWDIWADPSLDESASEAYAAYRANVHELLRTSNVAILPASGSPGLFSVAGFGLHREMVTLNSVGYSAPVLLQSATVTASALITPGEPQARTGRVEPGVRAEILLLDGNPLEDLSALRSPAAVVIGQELFTRDDLDEELESIWTRHHNALTD